MTITDIPDYTDEHGTRYTPWTDGGAIGFQITTQDGTVSYVYFNPSSESDDGISNVFVYQGPAGNPNEDGPVCYLNVNEGAAR